MKKGRALCIRLSSLGDIINTLPAVELLREDYEIDFVTQQDFKDIAFDNPLFSRLFLLPLKKIKDSIHTPFGIFTLLKLVIHFLKEVRNIHYDAIYDFHSNFKSSLIAWCARSPLKKGYDKGDAYDISHIFFNAKVSTKGKPMHRQDKFALLTGKKLGSSVRIILPPISHNSRQKLNSFLNKHNISDYIVIHPGVSKRGIAKSWSDNNWLSLIFEINRLLSIPVVITWGKSEYRKAFNLSKYSSCLAIPSFRTETLSDLRAVITGSKLFISADTGPLYLAAAEGVESIGLFGPKDPFVYAPRSPNFHLIKSKTGNSDDITVETVMKVIISLIKPCKQIDHLSKQC